MVMAASEMGRKGAASRWSKATIEDRLEQSRRMARAREAQEPSTTMPVPQDARTNQILVAGTTDLGHTVSQTKDLWERVNRRMKSDGVPKQQYWNLKFQEWAITLEEIAKDFLASGQPEKCAQVTMMLMKFTKDLAKPAAPSPPPAEHSAEDTANRIDFTAMSEEQLKELAAKSAGQDS
jgi:hypothetical protein